MCFVLTTVTPAFTQTCTGDGCDSLTASDLRGVFAAWGGAGSDCNGDGEVSILDFVCVLSEVPDLDPPQLNPVDDQTVGIGQQLSFTVSATDPNGDTPTYSAESLPENATLDSNTGQFDFTPVSGQRGVYQVTFKASDGLLVDTMTVSITVAGGGLDADPADLSVAEDNTLVVVLTGTAEATDDPVFEIVDEPETGVLTGTPPEITYLPDPNVHGNDQFTFRIGDGIDWSEPAAVTITITPVNDPPTVQDLHVLTTAETPVPLVLVGNDPDQDTLDFIVESQPAHGTLSGTAPDLVYTPADGYLGLDSFTFRAEDGFDQSGLATVMLNTALGAPTLDQHDTLTTEETILLEGDAPAADEVEIAWPAGLFTVPVTNGRFSADVPLLSNRKNMIFLTSVKASERSAPRATNVTNDGAAPSLAVLFPPAGARLTAGSTDVAGTVGDSLSGFLGLTVTVNGRPALVDVGIGTNGSFFAEAVPLNGDALNDLVVVARDALGNEITRMITVLQETAGPNAARLQMISGNGQDGTIQEVLGEPVVVKVTNPDGSPLVGKTVTFKVNRSDGRLGPGARGVQEDTFSYQTRTDSDGLARAWWRMGMDAGCGNNRLEVTSAGVADTVYFCASAAPAPARQINVGTGNNQRAEVGAPACEPLVVWVSDGCNGVTGVPVTFRTVGGSGKVNEQDQVTVLTSETGHARVNAALGSEPGNHYFEADFPNNPGEPVVFSLFGYFREEGRPTSFSGLVIDNANRPIEGARCILEAGGQSFGPIFSSVDGTFSFTDIPDGSADLYVNGLVATGLNGAPIPAGSFPSLHFEPVIVPNVDNQLPIPVKLPQLNPANAVVFDNTQDVILRVEEMEGLEMLVKAGSMTRPDGTKPSPFDPAILSLNAVHADDVPMPMPDGAAPPFAWTLQPGGAHFDPPIEIRYPNMSGLPPGAVAWFLSFDHDTNNFEIVASSTVSEDGTTIVTDPGVGLSIAGWGCNCPPYAVTGECEMDPCEEALEDLCDRADADSGSVSGPISWQLKCLAERSCEEDAPQWVKNTHTTNATNNTGIPFGEYIPGWLPILIPSPPPLPRIPVPASEIGFVIEGHMHFALDLIPSWWRDCETIDDDEHNHFLDETLRPCLQSNPELSPVLKFFGDKVIPFMGKATREIIQTLCPLKSFDLSKAGELELPPPPEKENLFIPGLNESPLEVSAVDSRFFLNVGDTVQLRVRRQESDGSYTDITATDTLYFGMTGRMPDAVSIDDQGLMTVLDTPSPITSIRLPLLVIVRNGDDFGIGQFAIIDDDTDGDFIVDTVEVRLGLDPLQANTLDSDLDGDKLADILEVLFGTHPLVYDTDGDNLSDGYEVENNFDPLSPSGDFLAIDDTWTVTVNGQAVQVNPDGTFRIPNISAADQFGEDGPGSVPDFLSDDFLRLVGYKTEDGITTWVFSDPFQIRQGQTYLIDNLTFTTTPPPMPQSIEIRSETDVIAPGETLQLSVIGLLADGTPTDLTGRDKWTVYRTSNRLFAVVDKDGLVTARREGTVMITAVNEGAVSVKRIIVAGNTSDTTAEGFVRLNGNPVEGAEVRSDIGGSVTTAPDGSFSLTLDVPGGSRVALSVSANVGGEDYRGGTPSLPITVGGITDFGFIDLIPGRDTDGDGITDDWEAVLGLNANSIDSNGNGILDGDEDRDGDGLTNRFELAFGLDPGNADSDGNGIPDGEEDSDGDGLTNLEELAAGTDPFSADTDGDGMSDGYEVRYGLNPNNLGDVNQDPDGDGLTNGEEAVLGTDPFNGDLTPPQVAAVLPDDGATDIRFNQMVVIRFDEPLSPLSVGPDSIVLFNQSSGNLPGESFLSVDGLSLVFRPDFNQVPHGEEIRVTVSGLTDLAGNPMAADHVTTYTTNLFADGEAPSIRFANPENSEDDVPLNAAVTVVFDERMDPSSFTPDFFYITDTVSGERVAGEIQIADDYRRVSFLPVRPFAVGRRHDLNLSTNVTDLAGIGLSGNRFFRFTTAFQPDTQAPALVRSSPADGQTDVPLNTRIMLDFSEPLRVTALDEAIVVDRSGNIVTGTLETGLGNRRVTFVPDALLQPGAAYRIAVSEDMRDRAGNPLVGAVDIQFTTGTELDEPPPQIVSVDPGHNSDQVPLDIRPSVAFSESVNPLTVDAGNIYLRYDQGGINIPADLTLSADNTTVTLTPVENLKPGFVYRFYVTDVEDLPGQTVLGSAHRATFTTTGEIDDQPPTVQLVSPPDGSSGVPVNAVIAARFDEPVRTSGFRDDMFTVSAGGPPVSGSYQFSNDYRSIVFTPDGPLASGTSYTVQLGGMTDFSGNPAAVVQTSFTTSASSVADQTGPEVVSISPAHQETGVDPFTPVVITFSEAVDPLRVNPVHLPITVEGVSGNLAGEYSTVGAVVTFTPRPPDVRTPPPNRRIRVIVHTGVRDLAGNGAVYFSSWYDTGGDQDTTPPFVVSMTPADGSTGMGPYQHVSLLISESLDADTINSTNFLFYVNGQALSTGVERSVDNRRVTLRRNLPADSVINVIASNGATDLSGNPLTEFSGSFTTGPAADFDRPSVSIQIPSGNARNVPSDTAVTLYTSEPLDPATVSGAFFVSENGRLKEGSVSVTGNGRALVFAPTNPFLPGAEVRVFLEETALDPTGNTVYAYQGIFYIAEEVRFDTPPVLIDYVGMDNGAPVNTILEIAWSKPLDLTTISANTVNFTQGGSLVSSTIGTTAGGRHIRITPRDPLLPETTYNVRIFSNSIFDTDGNPLPSFNRWFTTGSGSDLNPPALTLVSPPDGFEGASLNSRIRVRFDEPVNRLSVNGDSLRLQAEGSIPVDFGISFTNDNLDVLVQPVAPLAPNALHTVTLSGIRDMAGLPLPVSTFQFLTGDDIDLTRPSRVSTNPPNNATDIPLSTAVSVFVDEPLDPGSLDANFYLYDGFIHQRVPGTRQLSADGRTAWFIPDAPLAPGRDFDLYYYELRDLAGNQLRNYGRLDFRTGLHSDLEAPEVVDAGPPANFDIPTNALIFLRFSEPVKPETLDVSLETDQPVSFSTAWSDGNRVVKLRPIRLLPANTTVSATLSNIQDISGNALTTPYTLSFSTETGTELNNPRIVQADPRDNSYGVPVNAKMRVYFDQPVSSASVHHNHVYLYRGADSKRVQASLSLSADGRAVTLTPNDLLETGTDYIFRVSSLENLAGRGLNNSIYHDFTTALEEDHTSPFITAVNPPDNATGVPLSLKLRFRFNEDISVESLHGNTVLLTPESGSPVTGTLGFGSNRDLLEFDPHHDLLPDTNYSIGIERVTDLAGNLMTPFTAGFTTGGTTDTERPRVTSISPVDGADDVPLETPIVITFSEPVDPTLVTPGTIRIDLRNDPGLVVGSFQVSGNVVTFTPQPPQNRRPPAGSQVDIYVSSSLRDLAGNSAVTFSSSYTTGGNPDDQTPFVVSVSPVDGADGINRDQDVILVFSESLQAHTVNNRNLNLLADGTALQPSVIRSPDSRVITLRDRLPENSTITVVATGDLLDQTGNRLEPFTASFTTGPAYDNTRPQVVSARPADRSNRLNPNTGITFFLNKPLDENTLADAFLVTENGVAKAGDALVTAAGKAITFQAATPYAFGARIQVFLTDAALTTEGEPFLNYDVDFTIQPDSASENPHVIDSTGIYNGTPRNTRLHVRFNETLDPATVNANNVILTDSDRNQVLSAVTLIDGSVIRLEPQTLLESEAFYTLEVTRDVLDLQGNAINRYARSFTTGADTDESAPEVILVSPMEGLNDLGINALVRVRFSEAVDPTMVSLASLSLIDASRNPLQDASIQFVEGNREILVTPHLPLQPGTAYNLVVSGLVDGAGNLSPEFTTGFTTGELPDVSRPVYINGNPRPNASDVPINSIIQVGFNEPVDPGSIFDNDFYLYQSGFGTVAGTRSISNDGRTVTFVPESGLAAGEDFRLYFYDVRDVAGNPITGTTSFRFYTGFDNDTTGPEVTMVSPPDGWTDTPLNPRIAIQFNEPIQAGGLEAVTLSSGETTAVTYTLSNGNRKLTLTPKRPLAPGTAYTLTINGQRDLAGNAMSQPVSTVFTTADDVDLLSPVLSWIDPVSGARDVPTNARVALVFNEAMDPTSILATQVYIRHIDAGRNLETERVFSDDLRRLLLIPAQLLIPANRYEVYVTGITDTAGNPLSGNSWRTTFTVGLSSADTAPNLIALSPPNGAVNVPVNASVRARFDRPVSTAVAGDGALTLSDGNRAPVSGSLTFSNDRRSVIFQPDQPLLTNTAYSFEGAGLTGLAGNMIETFAGSFTTIADDTPDTTRPRVISSTPADDATEVSINAQISLVFDEPLDPTSVNADSMRITVSGQNGNLPGEYSVAGANAVFTPYGLLPADARIIIQVTGNVRDLAGNGSYSFNADFYTANELDTTPPNVLSMTPADGSTGIAVNQVVTLTFDEPLRSSTIGTEALALFAGGEKLSATVSRSADNRTVTLGADFPPHSTVTVAATSMLTDLAGNPLPDFTGSFQTGPGFDNNRPSVNNTRPAGGAGQVDPASQIVVFINEPLDASSIPGAVFVTQDGVVVAGTVLVEGEGRMVRFIPDQPFAYDASIQITLTDNATDLQGNALYTYQSSFRTRPDPAGEQPRLIDTSGFNDPVRLDVIFELGFDKPLDPATVTGEYIRLYDQTLGETKAASVTLVASGRVIRLAPDTPLVSDNYYRFRIDGNVVLDLDGNAISSYNDYFYAGTESGLPLPGIDLVSPPDGFGNVSMNTRMQLVFDAPVNPLSVNPDTITLTAGRTVLGEKDFSFSDGDRRVLITPHIPLVAETTYTLTASGLTDLAGTALPDFTTTFTTGSTVDTVRANIVDTLPRNREQKVPVNTVLTALFDEPVDPTLNAMVLYDYTAGSNVAGTVILSPDSMQVRFVPDSPLGAGHEYSMQVGHNSRDLAGNYVNGRNFSFTTDFSADDTPPTVTRVSPADAMTNVPTNSRITIRFDETISAFSLGGVSLSTGGSPVDLIRRKDDASLLTLIPKIPLTPTATYTLRVEGVQDLSGNEMATAHVTQFTTAAGVDLTRPSISFSDPAGNAVDVPLDTLIHLRFSERIDPNNITSDNCYLTHANSGRRVAVTYVFPADRKAVSLIPNEPLGAGQEYYVRLSSTTDLTGQSSTNSWYTYFTTGLSEDDTSPTVLAVSPPNGATGVPVNAPILVRFDEPMSANAVDTSTVSLHRGGSALDWTWTLTDNRTLLTVNPVDPLPVSASISLDLTGLTDLSGNELTFQSGFTTGADSEADLTRPSVTSVSPANDAVDVPPATPIVLTFSEVIDPTSVTRNTVRIYNASIDYLAGAYSVNGAVVTFTPKPNDNRTPVPQSRVNIRVSSVRDLAGNSVSTFYSDYTTGGEADTIRPRVTSVSPIDGSQGLGPDTRVVLTFSEALEYGTIGTGSIRLFADGEAVSTSLSRQRDNRSVIITSSNLPSDSLIDVVATDGLTDHAGNPLIPFSSSFRTAPAADESRPSVIRQRPAAGANNVAPDATVTLFTNEALDPNSLPGGIFATQNGEVIAGQVTLSPDGRAVTFLPDQPFAFGASIRAFFTEDVHDLSGNRAYAYNQVFRIATDPLNEAPYLVDVTGVSGAALNTVIRIGYSEPLDAAGVTTDNVILRRSSTGTDHPVRVDLVDGSTVIRMRLESPLEAQSSYRVIIPESTVFDLQGEAVPALSYYFSTSTEIDSAVPVIEHFSPPAGFSNISLNALVRIRFSERMNRLTFNESSVSLVPDGGSALPLSIAFEDGDREVILTPQTSLPPQTLFEVTLDGVTDRAGNAVVSTTRQFTTGDALDTTPPDVLSTNPVDNNTDVPVNTPVIAVFNEPIDPGTLENHVYIYDRSTNQRVDVTLSISPDARTLTLVPTQLLTAETSYYLYLDDLLDLSGNRLPYHRIDFTTSNAVDLSDPNVIRISPEDGATGLPINTRISVMFSEPIRQTDLEEIELAVGGLPVPVERGLIDGRRLAIVRPLVLLDPATDYRLDVGIMRDTAGNSLPAPISAVFTSGSGADLVRPFTTVVDPEWGASAVPTNSLIYLGFSEPIDPNAIRDDTFYLWHSESGRTPTTITLPSDRRGAFLFPLDPLDPNTRYDVYATEITDLAGNPMTGSSRVTYFVTETGAATGPMTVTTTTPTDGATGIAVNSALTLQCDRSIAASSLSPDAVRLSTAGNTVDGDLSFGGNRSILVFTPSAPLQPGTTYTLEIQSLYDLANNTVTPIAITFTTALNP
ncbi:MAG: Ig-like domain-containing protein [Acidobacteriota bacterium]|nr:Ig-like domain-containing protein [Acidobacteriota bacterium]